ncbi:response regulator transcription factor [Novosphingobium sp. Gsoil 351]|uniref:response regulator n=1 Tax=Novosphingobium sp. Gsoil 351 TaxID=2675225 RepID=UPI0012B4E75E|nr:response regulator transcription factor [Novosphingobium sp. Gsoil 351]QGN54475.1 response regulator [Novosphingobium sp. Gsoil 351]
MSIRVLLADDHPFIRSGVESVLRDSEFEVVAAVGTGAEALAGVARLDPAVAILDVRMPEGDGLEVLQAMRGRGDERPVVLLTADLEDGVLLAALEAGVQGIVLKQGGEDHLLECLREVHAGRRWIPAELLDHAERVGEARANSPFKRLTPREAEMAWQVGKGMRNQDIAQRFELSEGAVKFALHTVFKKLGVTTRTELALLLQRYGYL